MSLSCDHCALSDICLPSSLSKQEIELLEQHLVTSIKIKKGEELYSAGSIFSGLYAVKSGSFKSIVSSVEGDIQIVGFHMPGELIGFDGYASSHSSSVVALESSMYCKVSTKHLDYLTDNIKGVSKHINVMVANDIQAQHSALFMMARKTAEQRVICFLKNISDRNTKRGFSNSEFSLSMPRGDIANFLGMAPETISRLLAQLQDEKIVEINHREVHICNHEELSRRSCGQSKVI